MSEVTSVVVEIVARDIATSLAFYRLLGLPVPEHAGEHVEVALPGGYTLAFDIEEVIAGMHPGWSPPAGAGRVAVAFGMNTAAEVDEVFQRLVAAGHPGVLSPFDAPWGQRYATVEDPDGITVDLFAPLS
ncbi:VOC family protein [Mycolicibacterium sp. 050158]|uniref:VOC family protein n=1 Tax=Mycolicibacterium sp. 050158 TaxID=3090602 RepID=UPI00299EDCD9|nr:VOC family protein [Mycolicibacterium sp. 050158]MDX1889997.1 VOC family protein [Mycolicibacterium sp. 050158]